MSEPVESSVIWRPTQYHITKDGYFIGTVKQKYVHSDEDIWILERAPHLRGITKTEFSSFDSLCEYLELLSVQKIHIDQEAEEEQEDA